jgi:hypothetical protein
VENGDRGVREIDLAVFRRAAQNVKTPESKRTSVPKLVARQESLHGQKQFMQRRKGHKEKKAFSLRESLRLGVFP